MAEYLTLGTDILPFYLIDFVIAMLILTGIRWLSGLIANVSSTEELAHKDNPAFGISIAGATIAISIVLMGLVTGEESGSDPMHEVMLVLVFGLCGIALMWLTRILFDHLSFSKLSIHDEMMKGNIAASIVDAGNMIATAIIIKAIMGWVDNDFVSSLIALCGGYICSQVLMVAATIYRSKVYSSRHNGEPLHNAIEAGNSALALRFSGYRIGIALAVTGASGIVKFSADNLWVLMAVWALCAVVLFVVLTVLAVISRNIILSGIDVAEEVDNQKNVAVGVIEASIYVAIGLILSGLLG